MENKKILIADDNTDVLFILEKELRAKGYSVISTKDGNQVKDIAKSEHPDLIILDIRMPDADGMVVAARLKLDPVTENIPVLFLTCLLSKKIGEEQGRVIGDNVFIAKPYSLNGLLSKIEDLTAPMLC